MKRRLSKLAAIVLAGASSMFGCSASHEAIVSIKQAPGHRPNVIIILADDLGYADIGVQAQMKDVRTPNIDSIARNGARFTNGYVTCPVCSPSRAGLLTGRYQERYGHEFNPGAGQDFGLPLDQILLPQLMKSAGYSTGMIGKWHEGNKAGYRPPKRGFDEFFGFWGGSHPYSGFKSGGANPIVRGDTPVDEEEYLTDAFSREAVAYIHRHKSEPFFLYLAYNAVHTPQQAPQKYLDRFPDETDKKRKMMLAMLAAEDDGVGEVLKAIKGDGIDNNTIVWFLSDNGGPTDSNGSRNAPFSGYKGTVWEGGIREPFMVQWPGHFDAGRVIDHPVISMDIFATSVSIAAGKAPSDRKMDGVDLVPLLTKQSDQAPHDKLYWRFGPQHAIREGNWKLVHIGDGEKLFDLSNDLGEKHDLLSSNPQVLARLRADYEAWNKELKEPLWAGKRRFHEGMDQIMNQGPMLDLGE